MSDAVSNICYSYVIALTMTEESHHLITCCYFHYHLFVKSIEADFRHLPINFNVKPLRCGCTGWVLSGKSKYDIERHCKYNVHQAYIEKVEKEGVQQASIEKFVDGENGNEAARLKMAGTRQGCLNGDDKAFYKAITKQILQNGIPLRKLRGSLRKWLARQVGKRLSHDVDLGRDYIPVLLTKEEVLQCLELRDEGELLVLNTIIL